MYFAGFHWVKDCTSPLTAPECTDCEPQTFRDYPNHDKTCESCKKCGTNGTLLSTFESWIPIDLHKNQI